MLKRIISPLLLIGFLWLAMQTFNLPLVDQAIAQRGLGATNMMRQQQRQQMQMQRQRQQQMRRQREQQAQRQRQMTRQREMRRQRQLAQQKQMKQRQIAQKRQREQARKRQQAAQRSRQSSNGAVAVAATARRAGGASASAAKPKQQAPSRVDANRGARLAALKSGSKTPTKQGGATAKTAAASGGGKKPPGGITSSTPSSGSPSEPPRRLTPIFNAATKNTLASRARIVGDRLRNLKGKVALAKPAVVVPTKKSVGMSGKAANMPHEFKRAGSPKGSEGAKQRPPYDKLSRAREIVLKRDRGFVRVYNNKEGNKEGSWLLRSKDIKGLTPAQIKDKFALKHVPTSLVQVKVPAGTRVRVGSVAAQKGWGGGGKTQYELKGDNLPASAFGKSEPLPSNVN